MWLESISKPPKGGLLIAIHLQCYPLLRMDSIVFFLLTSYTSISPLAVLSNNGH